MTSSIASSRSTVTSIGGISSMSMPNDNNILKLKLKKPKSWNWELSTSKSSSQIDFPRILLYDSNDKLLADVEEADCIINGVNYEQRSNSTQNLHKLSTASTHINPLRQSASFSTSKNSFIGHALNNGSTTASSNSYSIIDSNSANLIKCNELNSTVCNSKNSDNSYASCSTTRTIKKCKRSLSTNSHDVNELLSDVVSQLKDQGYECKIRRKNSNSQNSFKHQSNLDILNSGNCSEVEQNLNEIKGDELGVQQKATTTATIASAPMLHSSSQHDVKLPEIPIYICSGKGMVRRDFNAKEFDTIRNRQKATLNDDNLNPILPYNTNDIECTDAISTEQKNRTNHDNDTAINFPRNNGAQINRQPKQQHHLNILNGFSRPNNEVRHIEKSKSVSEMPASSTLSPSTSSSRQRKRERRKVRRVKSVNITNSSSPSPMMVLGRHQIDEWKKFDASQIDNNVFNNEPVYQLCTSAAGVLIVPDEHFCSNPRIRRRRRRPKSWGKTVEIVNDSMQQQHQQSNKEKLKFMEVGDNDVTEQSFFPNENVDTTNPMARNEQTKRNRNPKTSLTYSNADTYSSRYHKAMANIDNLITNVILSHTLDGENNKMCNDGDDDVQYGIDEYDGIVSNRNKNDELKNGAVIIEEMIAADRLNWQKLNNTSNDDAAVIDAQLPLSISTLPYIKDDHNKTYRKCNENSICALIKSKNNQFDVNATSDATIVPNNVNSVTTTTEGTAHCYKNSKQKKKSQPNRKVSFVQQQQQQNDSTHNRNNNWYYSCSNSNSDSNNADDYNVLLNRKNVNNQYDNNGKCSSAIGSNFDAKSKNVNKLSNRRRISRSASATYCSRFNYVTSKAMPFESSTDSDDNDDYDYGNHDDNDDGNNNVNVECDVGTTAVTASKHHNRNKKHLSSLQPKSVAARVSSQRIGK